MALSSTHLFNRSASPNISSMNGQSLRFDPSQYLLRGLSNDEAAAEVRGGRPPEHTAIALMDRPGGR
jgi:hypothetical protein